MSSLSFKFSMPGRGVIRQAREAAPVRSDFPHAGALGARADTGSEQAPSAVPLGSSKAESLMSSDRLGDTRETLGTQGIAKEREARRLMLAAQRVQRGQSLRGEVPLTVSIDWTSQGVEDSKARHSVARAAARSSSRVSSRAEKTASVHFQDHATAIFSGPPAKKMPSEELSELVDDKRVAEKEQKIKEAEWERERTRLNRIVERLELEVSQEREQAQQKKEQQLKVKEAEWERERTRLNRTVERLELEVTQEREQGQQEQRQIDLKWESERAALRAECDKVKYDLVTLQQEFQQQQQHHVREQRLKVEEVEALTQKIEVWQAKADLADAEGMRRIQILETRLAQAELAREQALVDGESIKQDYTQVFEERMTSKERLQKMSKSFQEVAEANVVLKKELKERKKEQGKADKEIVLVSEINKKLSARFPAEFARISHAATSALASLTTSARAAKELRDAQVRQLRKEARSARREWRQLLMAHPGIQADGEIQSVVRENQHLLAAIGADKKSVTSGGYSGPQLWSMYKKTSDELQKATKDHQQVKERISSQLHWTQATLESVKSELEMLRKESKRQAQRLQHRDNKLMALAQQGVYIPEGDEDTGPGDSGGKGVQGVGIVTQQQVETNREHQLAEKQAYQEEISGLKAQVEELQQRAGGGRRSGETAPGSDATGGVASMEEKRWMEESSLKEAARVVKEQQLVRDIEALRADKSLQAQVLQHLRRKVKDLEEALLQFKRSSVRSVSNAVEGDGFGAGAQGVHSQGGRGGVNEVNEDDDTDAPNDTVDFAEVRLSYNVEAFLHDVTQALGRDARGQPLRTAHTMGDGKGQPMQTVGSASDGRRDNRREHDGKRGLATDGMGEKAISPAVSYSHMHARNMHAHTPFPKLATPTSADRSPAMSKHRPQQHSPLGVGAVFGAPVPMPAHNSHAAQEANSHAAQEANCSGALGAMRNGGAKASSKHVDPSEKPLTAEERAAQDAVRDAREARRQRLKEHLANFNTRNEGGKEGAADAAGGRGQQGVMSKFGKDRTLPFARRMRIDGREKAEISKPSPPDQTRSPPQARPDSSDVCQKGAYVGASGSIHLSDGQEIRAAFQISDTFIPFSLEAGHMSYPRPNADEGHVLYDSMPSRAPDDEFL